MRVFAEQIGNRLAESSRSHSMDNTYLTELREKCIVEKLIRHFNRFVPFPPDQIDLVCLELLRRDAELYSLRKLYGRLFNDVKIVNSPAELDFADEHFICHT